MKKSFKTIWILAVLLFVFWNLFSFFFGRNAAELVQYGTMEDAFSVSGLLFKDEKVCRLYRSCRSKVGYLFISHLRPPFL